MEIIKNTVRVGNSAGVLLPKKWLNSQVKIVLQPLNIEREAINILSDEGILKNVMGIYLVGSYASEEQTIDSDIDILVITSNIDKRIKRGKYEIICISKKQLENQLKNNAFPILAMLIESKEILNKELIEKYKGTELTKENLRWYVETTNSAMKVVKVDISISREMNEKVSDSSSYSLILRLRTLYIIDCIKNKKQWNKKDFLKLIKKISGSLIAYNRYINSKNKNTKNYELPLKEAEKIIDYINKNIKELEKWLKE